MVRAELQAIERIVREQETAVEINPLDEPFEAGRSS
jgi:hypothetical protein